MLNSNKAAVRIINRVMIIPPETQIIAVTGDNNAESVQFEIPRWYDGTDMGAKEAFIDLETPDGYFDRVVPNRLIDEDKITLEWIVTAAHAAKNGVIKARVRVQSDGFVWQSQTGYFTVSRTFVQEGAPIPEPQITAIDQALTQIEAARQDSIAAAEEARGDGAQAVQIAQDAADAVHAQIDRADADIRAQINLLDTQTREQADTVEAEVRAQAQAAVDDLAATALRTSASKYDFVAPQGNPVQVRAARKSAVVVESDKDCEVRVCGRNLLPVSDTDGANNGITKTINADGSITIKGTATERTIARIAIQTNKTKLPSGQYTMSVASVVQSRGEVLLGHYNAGGVYAGNIARIPSGKSSITFTLAEKSDYLDGYYNIPAGMTVDTTIYPQLELGSTPTPYEPYTGSTATLTANTPTELTAPDSDVTTILATAGTLSVRYNRESMDTLKAITCETADEGAVATIHPVADAPVHVRATYTAKQHFDWYKVESVSSQVKTTGKNLLDVSGFETLSKNGVTFTPNNDGTISVKGTASANTDSGTIPISLRAGTYSSAHNATNVNMHISFIRSGQRLWHIGSFTLDGTETDQYAYFTVQAGKSVDTVIRPMLVEGDYTADTIPPYEPYSGGHASPSPDWLQPITSNVPAGSYYVPSTAPAGGYWRLDLDGDLGGVTSSNGTSYKDALEIDEYTGRWRRSQHIFERIVDGTEDWTERSGYGSPTYSLPFPSGIIARTGLCSHYKVFASNAGIGTERGIHLGYTVTAIITEPSCTSLEQFKSFLAAEHAAGHPVTIHYALAEPIVTTGQATRVGNVSGLTALPVASMGLTVPDPDHPCEITGVEAARVRACGKNLFDINGLRRVENGDEVITVQSDKIIAKAWVTRILGNDEVKTWFKPGATYTFSGTVKRVQNPDAPYAASESRPGFALYNSNKEHSVYLLMFLGLTGSAIGESFTLKSTVKLPSDLSGYELVCYSEIWRKPGETSFIRATMEFSDLSITLEPDTPYTPYSGATQTATLPAPLYGLPDAPATYDSDGWMEDGTACAIYNGSESWIDYRPEENTETYFGFCSALPSPNHIDFASVWSNYLKFGPASSQGYSPNTFLPHTNGNIYVRVEIPGVNSVDTWRAYLAEHPLQILYRIAPARLAAPPMHLGGVNPDCHVYGNGDTVTARSIEDPKWAKQQLNARQSAAEDTTLANSEKLADIAPADKIALNYIPGLLVHRWGVEVPADGNPECKRLYEAEGMVANAHKGSYNASLRNDFDDVFLMAGRKRLNYDLAGKRILAYEGDAAFEVNGSNGDVFVRQPAHWRKRDVLPDGREIRAFADGALAGYEYVPERLIGSFMASAADAESAGNNGTGTMRSICGAEVTPLTSVSLQNFLAKAKNSKCTLLDMDTYADQADIMLIEFANRNIQAVMGNGIASNYYNNTTRPLISETGANRVVIEKARAANIVAGWNTICISTMEYNFNKAGYRLVTAVNVLNDTQSEVAFAGAPVDILTTDYVCVTKNRLGQSEGILTGSGYIGINGKSSVKYRGVEDVFGHVFQVLLGVLKLGSHPPVYYYCDEPAKYAMSVTEDYREIGRCNIDAEGYVKTVLHNETAPFATSLIADQVGASTTTYWCDYVWRNAQGNEEPGRLRVPFAGGRWAGGSVGGPWFLSWICAPSGTSWYYGSRLLVIPPWGVRGA